MLSPPCPPVSDHRLAVEPALDGVGERGLGFFRLSYPFPHFTLTCSRNRTVFCLLAQGTKRGEKYYSCYRDNRVRHPVSSSNGRWAACSAHQTTENSVKVILRRARECMKYQCQFSCKHCVSLFSSPCSCSLWKIKRGLFSDQSSKGELFSQEFPADTSWLTLLRLPSGP